ncbi:MAG: DMT family transporter [Ignavibacteria bacterium]|nr:DMT family transporter [Ignavibacteria bacterium]
MKYKAEFILFIITVIWAGTFVIIKPVLELISPMVFVSIRFILAAIILFFIYRKRVFNIPMPTVKMGSVLGFFLFAGFTVQTIGLKYTSATKSALITGTFVVFTPILQLFVERKPPKIGSVIGVVLVFLGLLSLSSTEGSLYKFLLSIGRDFNIGDFLTLICALYFAGYIVYLDMISNKTEYRDLVWVQILFTAIGAVISMTIFHWTKIESVVFNLNSQVIWTILYTTIFATIITTFLQTRYQRLTTPTRAAIIFTCEPLIASILAYLILSETIGIFGIIGGALIIFGVLISEIFDDLIAKMKSG